MDGCLCSCAHWSGSSRLVRRSRGLWSGPGSDLVAPCRQPAITTTGLVAAAEYDVHLPTFRGVCLLARHLAHPEENGFDVIGFEIWRGGARACALPMPSRYLWNGFCDAVLAVAFPRHREQVDVIVMGSCLTAGRDDLIQSRIFPGEAGGSRLDADRSEAALGLTTIRQVRRKLEVLGANTERRAFLLNRRRWCCPRRSPIWQTARLRLLSQR